jgi:hypothetical protein
MLDLFSFAELWCLVLYHRFAKLLGGSETQTSNATEPKFDRKVRFGVDPPGALELIQFGLGWREP